MPDQRSVIAGTAKHLQEQMNRTVGAMASLQGDTPGTRQRGKREQNAIFNRISALPREERQSMMVAMAERAGHQDGEQKMCELCRYLGSKAQEMVSK
jgi:hypothetical protein